MYLRYFLEGDIKSWLAVDKETEQRPLELCFPPVPALHAEIHLTQLLVKLGLEVVFQLWVVLEKLK